MLEQYQRVTSINPVNFHRSNAATPIRTIFFPPYIYFRLNERSNLAENGICTVSLGRFTFDPPKKKLLQNWRRLFFFPTCRVRTHGRPKLPTTSRLRENSSLSIWNKAFPERCSEVSSFRCRLSLVADAIKESIRVETQFWRPVLRVSSRLRH